MGAPEHVEQLQASTRALSAMGLTYADISEIEGISRDTVCTWGKGSSRAHGAPPIAKLGRTARVVHRLTNTLADIGRSYARGGAARVTVRRVCHTPDWALRLTLAAAQGWLVREAVMPPADGECYQGLPCTPTIETRPSGTYPGSLIAYQPKRGVWPVGADFKMAPQLRFPAGYRHIVVDVPNLLLWAKFSNGLPPGEYPWRPDTTGE